MSFNPGLMGDPYLMGDPGVLPNHAVDESDDTEEITIYFYRFWRFTRSGV